MAFIHSRLSIRAKLLTTIGLAMVASLLAAVIMYESIQEIHKADYASQELNSSLHYFLDIKTAHMLWSIQLFEFVNDPHKEKLAIETSGLKCKLGKYLYSTPRNSFLELHPDLYTLVSQVELPHLALHQSAIEIEKMKMADKEKALEIFTSRTIPLMENLRHFLTEIGKKLEAKKNGQDAIKEASRYRIFYALGVALLICLIAIGMVFYISTKAIRHILDLQKEKDAAHHRMTEEFITINQAMAKFVLQQMLTFLSKNDIREVTLGEQIEKEMAILFADIRDFTSYSESMSPQENFNFINSYLSRMGPIIRKHNGYVDNYMGDAIMALFPNGADDALQAGIAMQKEIFVYNKHRSHSGFRPIEIGIGIHIGKLMFGTIGEAERMQGTVISDAVNLASRLEGLTKIFGVQLIASQAILSQVKFREKYLFRSLGAVAVKGKERTTSVFEIFNHLDFKSAAVRKANKGFFEEGVHQYYRHEFDKAILSFQSILRYDPEDRAALYFVEKSMHFQKSGTTRTWNPQIIAQKY